MNTPDYKHITVVKSKGDLFFYRDGEEITDMGDFTVSFWLDFNSLSESDRIDVKELTLVRK